MDISHNKIGEKSLVRKQAISFGLVHIPVELNPVIKNNDTAFNMLHKKCGKRIRQQKICPDCGKEVNQNEILKGYQYRTDEYVTFSEEDFSKLQAKGDEMIEIIAFVNLKDIDQFIMKKAIT